MFQSLGVVMQTVDFEFKGLMLTGTYHIDYDEDGNTYPTDVRVYFDCPQRLVSNRLYERCLPSFWEELDTVGESYD